MSLILIVLNCKISCRFSAIWNCSGSFTFYIFIFHSLNTFITVLIYWHKIVKNLIFIISNFSSGLRPDEADELAEMDQAELMAEAMTAGKEGR